MRKVLAVVLVAAGTLVAQDPVDARGWLDRGVQAFKRGQYQAAATAFERAVQADPSLLAAQLYLGTAYMQMYIPGAASPENQRVAASAHAAFQKVLGMDAGNVVAMTSDASLYLNEKNWDAAQAGYEKLTAIQPNNADHYYSLGFIAWSRWYPSYSKARQDAGMQPADPGPIPDAAIRRQLKTRWDRVLQDGLTAMDRALAIRPDYADAMAYENLLIRERADLRDTKEEWQADVRVADQWVQKALDLKKAQAAAVPRVGGSGGGDRGSLPQITPITKVDPVYPARAIQAHIQGTVEFSLIVGADGRPRNISVLRGHPLLVAPALEALKQWTFAPLETRGRVEVSFVTP